MSDVTREKVKGIKFGTWEKYKTYRAAQQTAQELEDFANTLFFITNHGGAIYRGDSLVEPEHVIENCIGSDATVGETDTHESWHFDITTFQKSVNGTQNDPVTLSFDVYSKEAVNAIRTALENTMTTHRTIASGVLADGKGTSTNFGHVKLTDTVDDTTKAIDASYGVGTSPKGVYDAIAAAVGGIGGAMVFKGQIGKAAAYDSTATYAVDSFCEYDSKLWRCTTAITTAEAWNADHWTEVDRNASDLPTPHDGYEAGWTYRVCAPNTYAGQVCEVGDIIIAINDSSGSGTSVVNADWTVGQVNTDGTVTISGELINNALVLGSGTTTVKPLANGTAGQYLRIVNGVPTWVNHTNAEHGQAKCNCTTAGDTAAKEASLVDANAGTYVLLSGAVVAVKFTNAVPASSTLNVAGTGAKDIYFRGAAIVANIIAAGDTATFMYNGTYWDLLAVDKNFASVATSGNYDDLLKKAVLFVTDEDPANAVNRVILAANSPDAGEFTANSKRIIVVKYTYGLAVTSPTMKLGGAAARDIYYHGAAYNGAGSASYSPVAAGDMVTYVFDGTRFNIVAIDRTIDKAVTAGSQNLVTSGAVATAIQNAIDNAALWWEELS